MNTAVFLGSQFEGAFVGDNKFPAVIGDMVVHAPFQCL